MSVRLVTGRCYVVYGENLTSSPEEYRRAGPHRFYFTEAYDPTERKFTEPPPVARRMGLVGKVRELGRIEVSCSSILYWREGRGEGGELTVVTQSSL